MVTYDAGLISFYFCACEKNKGRQSSFFLHFSRRWITNLLTHRKIEIQTLSGKTSRMCMLAWSFSACLCDKYLNHIIGINNLAWAFIYIPSFSAMSEGSGETAQMCSLARSFAASICDIFHELTLKFLPEPSSTSLLFRDSLFAYAISTKLSWTGLYNLA